MTDNNLDDDVGRIDAKDMHLKQPSANDVTDNRWKKCVALKESESDITTQEEFYKFDFQVHKLKPHSNANFNLIFLTKCLFPRIN